MNKFLNKYKSLNVITKAALWFTLCGIIQKGISFVTVPIFTRIMSTTQYGQVTVYQSWSGTISVFATLNLAAGVFNTGLIKFDVDRDRFTSSLQGLSTTVTILVSLIILVFNQQFSNLTGLSIWILMLMMVEMIIEPSFGFWAARNRFEYKYVKLVLVTILVAILNPLIGLVMVHFSADKGTARIISIALVSLCLYLGIYISTFKKGRSFYHKDYWIYALKFNIPLIPHYLSNTILNQADRIMIANITGESNAGIYTVAYSCSMAINIVTNSLQNAIVPWIYENLKKENYTVIRNRMNSILIIVGLIILCVISVGPEVIRFMAPQEYYKAIWIIPPVTLSVYFMFLQSLYCNVEFYYEKNMFITVASISGALLNVLLNYIFISKYGFIAAGFTTLVCYILYCVSHGLFVNVIKRQKGITESIYNNKIILIISIIMVALTFAFIYIYEMTFVRYAVLILIGSILLFNRKRIISVVKGRRNG